MLATIEPDTEAIDPVDFDCTDDEQLEPLELALFDFNDDGSVECSPSDGGWFVEPFTSQPDEPAIETFTPLDVEEFDRRLPGLLDAVARWAERHSESVCRAALVAHPREMVFIAFSRTGEPLSEQLDEVREVIRTRFGKATWTSKSTSPVPIYMAWSEWPTEAPEHPCDGPKRSCNPHSTRYCGSGPAACR